MLKPILAILFATVLSCPLALADSKDNAEQQDKDLKNKQQIYGVKYPWQNTEPYGTQYTPPPGGSMLPQENEKEAKTGAAKADAAKAAKTVGKGSTAAKAKAAKAKALKPTAKQTAATNAAATKSAAKHALPKGSKHPIL